MKLFYEMLTCFFAALGVCALLWYVLFPTHGKLDIGEGNERTEKPDGTDNP